MRRPLMVLTVLFVLGIAASGCLRPSVAWLGGLLLCWAGLAGLGYWSRWRYTHWIIAIAFFQLGMFWGGLAWAERESSLSGDLGTHVTVVGWVAQEPKVYADHAAYRLAVERIDAPEGSRPVDELVLLDIYQTGRSGIVYQYGDVLKAYGQLKLPKSASNPGEFDYRDYLLRQGIFTQMDVYGPDEVVRLDGGRGNLLDRSALAIKERVVAGISRELPPNELAILQGIIFGDQEQLAVEDVKAYQQTGLFHIFSVSGMHIGFVLFLGLASAGLFRLSFGWSSLLTAVLLIGYGWLTGWPACVARAVLMGLLGLGAKCLNRDNDLLNSLAVAAWLILLWEPLVLYDLGFQLSFAATWGLVYLYPVLDEWLTNWPVWRGLILVPLAAQLATLPLVAYYFNQVALISLIANVLVVDLIGAVVLLGLGILPLTFLWPAAAGCLTAAAGGLIYFNNLIIHGLAKIPGGALTVPTPSGWLILVYYVILITIVNGWVRSALTGPNRRGWLAGALAVVLIVGLVWVNRPQPLRVVFLDVGQGDSIFIETPGGRRLLVDGGGRPVALGGAFDVGERVVLPYLRRQGVSRLDGVVNTHGHDDHRRGLIPVLRELDVGVLAVPANQPPPADLAAALKPGGQILPLSRGQIWEVEPGVSLEVLHPARVMTGTRSDGNNNSLVMRLCYGQTAVLLTGDIEREAMAEMLAAGIDLSADVCKLPHHGSHYGLAPRFLEAVNPKAVVIPVGKNSFGHPDQGVLDYWEGQGVPVYRTDGDGAVTVTSDGVVIKVKGFRVREPLQK